MSQVESVEALSLAGDISRLVLGKATDARQFYERALAQGGDRQKIGSRLEALTAVERIAEEKVRGNDVLKQRKR